MNWCIWENSYSMNAIKFYLVRSDPAIPVPCSLVLSLNSSWLLRLIFYLAGSSPANKSCSVFLLSLLYFFKIIVFWGCSPPSGIKSGLWFFDICCGCDFWEHFFFCCICSLENSYPRIFLFFVLASWWDENNLSGWNSAIRNLFSSIFLGVIYDLLSSWLVGSASPSLWCLLQFWFVYFILFLILFYFIYFFCDILDKE